MLALIDIGNTTIAIGLSKDRIKIDNILRINTSKTIMADEYAFILNQSLKGVTEAIISSVVPELNDVFKQYFQTWLDITPTFLGQGLKTGIKIMTDNPREVGTDIIANLVAATEHYGKTCIVIDLGTATTISFVDNLTFKGCIIAPGVSTSKNALISKTSLLPQVELEAPTKLIGTNSPDSIKSGLIYGHAAMIDGMIRRIFQQIGSTEIPVIMTGGHAKMIAPHCTEKMIIDENLILKGLLSVYKKNNAKSI
jgi:type III pantothenate kinase